MGEGYERRILLHSISEASSIARLLRHMSQRQQATLVQGRHHFCLHVRQHQG